VRRIWHAHGLKPHLIKTYKISNDREFAEKLEDIVGLYLNPPEHAMVLGANTRLAHLHSVNLPPIQKRRT
jgi:hypothetical protein